MRTVSDAELLKILLTESRYREVAQAQCEAQLVRLGERENQLARALITALERARSVRQGLAALQGRGRTASSVKAAMRLRNEAQHVLTHAVDTWWGFMRGPHRYLMPSKTVVDLCDDHIQETLAHLTKRLETALTQDLETCRNSLQSTIAGCREYEEEGNHHDDP